MFRKINELINEFQEHGSNLHLLYRGKKKMSSSKVDVVVVGGGHAGIEAALAAARSGLNVILATSNPDRIGYMSCNPSIGGLAKGHIVREIDILGGEMGRAADATCIQFKRLNSSKGPAVRGTRMQCDKEKYSRYMKNVLATTPGLRIVSGEVKRLLLENGTCVGVLLVDGSKILSNFVCLTTGTFMNGVMHIGLEHESGGRFGDKASIGLSDQLAEYGFRVRRLKTGTPPRLKSGSIDFSLAEAQYGDKNLFPFSFKTRGEFALPQIPCFQTRTTEETHRLIRENLHLSPMYTGIIEGVGPRYCPSIEDKINRFADRESHLSFLEPESLETDLVYLQGISTSLPKQVQDQFIRTLPGLKHVEILRYGYAVEYDFIEPDQIHHRLETRSIQNLFLAGQINGTSGYEEAAAQGFLAGINIASKFKGSGELVLGRDVAYMGVLVDDLVTKGTREPYRMFTSRAEHRLVLREDNTIDRLIGLSRGLGLLSSDDMRELEELVEERSLFRNHLQAKKIYPVQETQARLSSRGTAVLKKSITAEELLRRSEIQSLDLLDFGIEVPLDPRVHEAVEIDVKYEGYIRRQEEHIGKVRKFESAFLREDFPFDQVHGLSSEEREKLKKVKPRSIAQAQRISGVNPSAIQAIMIHLKKDERKQSIQERAGVYP